VQFKTQNRFEGRSSYFHYYPTGHIDEQKMEQIWFEHQNRRLQEKRRDEETKQIMNEWGQTRGRMEAEIQRRKEHINFATNFEEARGFVRTNWKSKNFNPNDDPTQSDSSEPSYGEEDEEEENDQVPVEINNRSNNRNHNDDYGSEDDFNQTGNNFATPNKKARKQRYPLPSEAHLVDVTNCEEFQSAKP